MRPVTLSLCCSQGKLDEALEFFEKALAIDMKVNGDSSVEVATTLNNIADVYKDQASPCENSPLRLAVRGRPMGVSNPLKYVSHAQVLELLAAYLSF